VTSRVETILCYEVPTSTEWSGRLSSAFQPTAFEIVSAENLRTKVTAFECYKGEIGEGTSPRSIEAIITRAKYRGNSVGRDLAESFVVVRTLYR
jgi:hypothetical protein